jgi:xylulokinase
LTAPAYATLFRTYTELYPATRRQVHRLARSVRPSSRP